MNPDDMSDAAVILWLRLDGWVRLGELSHFVAPPYLYNARRQLVADAWMNMWAARYPKSQEKDLQGSGTDSTLAAIGRSILRALIEDNAL